ncbi:hypothetical protein [Kitasatospora sp. KL5]|uniref:hypothetical protein n=1 Tax=Kitasatospora sp. KL5 TaxID=3425125 RepID=UPI003D6F5A00
MSTARSGEVAGAGQLAQLQHHPALGEQGGAERGRDQGDERTTDEGALHDGGVHTAGDHRLPHLLRRVPLPADPGQPLGGLLTDPLDAEQRSPLGHVGGVVADPPEQVDRRPRRPPAVGGTGLGIAHPGLPPPCRAADSPRPSGVSDNSRRA